MKPLDTEKLKSEGKFLYNVSTIASYNKYFIENKIIPTKEAIKQTIEGIDKELKNK